MNLAVSSRLFNKYFRLKFQSFTNTTLQSLQLATAKGDNLTSDDAVAVSNFLTNASNLNVEVCIYLLNLVDGLGLVSLKLSLSFAQSLYEEEMISESQ